VQEWYSVQLCRNVPQCTLLIWLYYRFERRLDA